MKRTKVTRRLGGVVAAGAIGSAILASGAGATGPNVGTGPNTTVAPYVLPSASSTYIASLLTVGDSKTAFNGYKMVGIPDALGASRRTSDGKVLVNMNHELGASSGIVRKNGQKGAFISRWVIDPVSMRVESGMDLTWHTLYWDPTSGTYTTTAPAGQTAEFARFCSGTTVVADQLFNPGTGRGSHDTLHFTGEENGAGGRATATTSNGVTRVLPRLGNASFENLMPAFNSSDTTTVVTTDDSAGGRLGVYFGRKGSYGNEVAKAGLSNGVLTNVKLADVTVATDAAFRAKYDKGDALPFGVVDINWNQSGANQAAEAGFKGALALNRIEDGAWDPAHPNDFYFVTTDGGEGTGDGGGGGLWRLRFNDIENPRAGGDLTLLLDGTEGITLNKPDNLTIDGHGNLLIQEDPGNVDSVSRILAYRISDGAMGTVAQFDPVKFDPAVAGAGLLTKDEESSGIIDVEPFFGPGWFLFDAQVHTAAGLPAGAGAGTVQEYVENGQLLAMRVTNWTAVYGS